MQSRYKSAAVIKDKNKDNKRRYVTNLYPKVENQINDLYIITKKGDRLDSLAHKYYGDTRLWSIIAQANHIGKGSLAIEPGIRIRIPLNISNLDVDLEKLNEDR